MGVSTHGRLSDRRATSDDQKFRTRRYLSMKCHSQSSTSNSTVQALFATGEAQQCRHRRFYEEKDDVHAALEARRRKWQVSYNSASHA